MTGSGPGIGTWDSAALAAKLAGRRLGNPLLVVAETESTNDLAWSEAKSGAPEGLLVVADRQMRGRGRAGHVWFSPPGVGVWASFLLRPAFSPRCLSLVPLASGVAAARAAERLGVPAGLKWPNDLLAPDGSGRKLGGVLAESRAEELGSWTVVVGIGMNVNTQSDDFPAALRGTAASLAMLAGRPLSREDYLIELVDALADEYGRLAREETDALLDSWRQRAVIFGRPVRVRASGAEVHGIARDLTGDGSLVVRLDSGAELEIRAGQLDLLWEAGSARA